MLRLICISSALALTLACGGCNTDSRPMADNEGSSNDAVRFDANGQKMYATRYTDRDRSSYPDGDRRNDSGSYSGTRSDMNSSTSNADRRRYDTDANSRSWRDNQTGRNDAHRTTWGDRTWNDPDVTMVSESDLPADVRSGLSREAGGASLSETGRGNWDGKAAYCARYQKNGRNYKVITDSAGNLIAMRRLD